LFRRHRRLREWVGIDREDERMDLGSVFSNLTAGGGIDPARITAAVTELFQSKGGVDGLIATLRNGGLGGVVDSWISTGSNQPADPQQLGAALGPDTTQQLAQKTGLSVEALLPILAALLPMIIDHLTPGGQLPKDGGTGSLNDLGGLLGGMLGGQGGLGGMFGGGENRT
jgi:uncharacterized protein YidB (DUF937 family)